MHPSPPASIYPSLCHRHHTEAHVSLLTPHDQTSHFPSAPHAEIRAYRAKGCTNTPAQRQPQGARHPAPPSASAPSSIPALPPLAGGWFGHSLPAQSRHLSCPVSSPLLPSQHQLPQLCRTPDGQTGLQPCRDPATARPPLPSPPASSSLAAARPGSHRDSCRVTTEGRRSTGTIADAHSERHTHTLDFSQPGGCSAPAQGQLAGLMCNALACDTRPH